MAALRHPNIVLFLGLTYSPPSIITGGSQPQRLNPKTAGAACTAGFSCPAPCTLVVWRQPLPAACSHAWLFGGLR